MSHKSFQMSTDTGAGRQRRTTFDRTELASAVIGMAGEISRPESFRQYMTDLGRGRQLAPLGKYPEIAEACAEAGASFFNVSKPLTVMLAHLRRRYKKLSGVEFREALCDAKRESDEAEAVALRLALSGSTPAASVLIAFEREATEAILALETAKELASDQLCAMQEAR